MSELVILKKEDLQQIVESCIKNVISDLKNQYNIEKPKQPERLNIDESVNFLKEEYGLDIPKARLYQENHYNNIQREKYGRRVIFTRSALQKWAESIKKVPVPPSVQMAERLATQARKERRHL